MHCLGAWAIGRDPGFNQRMTIPMPNVVCLRRLMIHSYRTYIQFSAPEFKLRTILTNGHLSLIGWRGVRYQEGLLYYSSVVLLKWCDCDHMINFQCTILQIKCLTKKGIYVVKFRYCPQKFEYCEAVNFQTFFGFHFPDLHLVQEN